VIDRCLLDHILEPGSLSVHFQPVLDVQDSRPKPHYLEALIRGPRGTSVENPSILFEYARKKSRESLVDRACVETILDAARDLPNDVRLGINVHASTLAMDAGFVDYLVTALAARRLSPRRLIIEVVEHAPPWDAKRFCTTLRALRRLGILIALDDVGLGHSNYMMVLECRPDYLKVDRYFVDGCHKDFYRRAVVASIAQLAQPFGARVVAEGVEKPDDLAALKDLGISLIQGFLYGKPLPAAEVLQATEAFTAGAAASRPTRARARR